MVECGVKLIPCFFSEVYEYLLCCLMKCVAQPILKMIYGDGKVKVLISS
jgi:hypothetical protein